MGLDGNRGLGSSRRTPGPIAPSIGDCIKASTPLRKRDHTAYGSRRSPGRRLSRNLFTATLAIISLLGLVLAMSPTAKAAELQMIAGGSMTGPLKQIVPQFERETGHKLVIHFDSTPNLIKQATSGAPLDLAVVPVDMFKDPAAKARFVAGPTIDIARVGYGVIVRSGAAKPDISTPDALKKTLLAAQSISSVPTSAAGAYVLKVFNRLGVAEEMQAKIKPQQLPDQIAPAVAKGEADLGVFLINTLIAPGVDLVGPFPADLQQELVFTSAVSADSKEADAAKAFIDYLRTPAATAIIQAAGMTPG
jgi:molybdate transport system substrate-binding protein